MSGLNEMDLPNAASLQRFRDGKQDVLEEDRSEHGNLEVSRLEFAVKIIESKPRFVITTVQHLVFSFQCHICGWEYVANSRCERCGKQQAVTGNWTICSLRTL